MLVYSQCGTHAHTRTHNIALGKLWFFSGITERTEAYDQYSQLRTHTFPYTHHTHTHNSQLSHHVHLLVISIELSCISVLLLNWRFQHKTPFFHLIVAIVTDNNNCVIPWYGDIFYHVVIISYCWGLEYYQNCKTQGSKHYNETQSIDHSFFFKD